MFWMCDHRGSRPARQSWTLIQSQSTAYNGILAHHTCCCPPPMMTTCTCGICEQLPSLYTPCQDTFGAGEQLVQLDCGQATDSIGKVLIAGLPLECGHAGAARSISLSLSGAVQQLQPAVRACRAFPYLIVIRAGRASTWTMRTGP